MKRHRGQDSGVGVRYGLGSGVARCQRTRRARERGRPGRGRGCTQAGSVAHGAGLLPGHRRSPGWTADPPRGRAPSARAECGRSARAAGRGRSPWVCTATFGTCASSPRRPGPPGGPPSTARRPGPAAAAVPGRRGAPGRCAAGRRSASGARRGPADRGGRPADAARGAGASPLTDTRASAGPRLPRCTCAEAREPPARRPRSRLPNPRAAPRRAGPRPRRAPRPGAARAPSGAWKLQVPSGIAGAGPCARSPLPRRGRKAFWGL